MTKEEIRKAIMECRDDYDDILDIQHGVERCAFEHNFIISEQLKAEQPTKAKKRINKTIEAARKLKGSIVVLDSTLFTGA